MGAPIHRRQHAQARARRQLGPDRLGPDSHCKLTNTATIPLTTPPVPDVPAELDVRLAYLVPRSRLRVARLPDVPQRDHRVPRGVS